MKPNQKQQEAIDKIEGPMLIIAGAGSWKTATLTARVQNMIENKGISPNNILMVTFTNKAASEMKQRVAKTLGVEVPRTLFSGRNFPTIGTFHSIWIYLLKTLLNPKHNLYEEISERIGLRKDFVIYDESDKMSVLKSIIKSELNLDIKEFPPRQIAFYISNAKNALITVKAYEREIDNSLKQVVWEVYTKYEQKLSQNNAMDFDDILTKTLSLLKIPQILEYYQEKYKYLMIDEYQDTNAPQYEIVRLLASKYRNLAVVWDDSQCLVEWTKVETEIWNKKIQDLVVWEKILSYDWSKNKKKFYEITDIYKNDYNWEIIEIETENWKKIKSTPEHVFFSSVEENFKEWFDYWVYLMYKFWVWYRIWFTRFKWLTKSKNNIYWLRKRLNWEQADFAWILKTSNSKQEAKYFEQLFSFQFWIPQTVFTAAWKLSELDQNDIDNIYKKIDTEKNALELLNNLWLSKDYPHVITQWSNRFNKLRVNINLLIMWWNEKNRRFWMFRVTVHTSHQVIIDLLKLHFPKLCRKSKLWIRIDKELSDYSKIWELSQEIHKVLSENNINTCFIQKMSYTNKSLLFLNAWNIHSWFWISVWNEEKNIYEVEKVISVNRNIQKTNVYDLNIWRTHNFVANGIVTHNSIYSWRWANLQNILNFKKDYTEAVVIKLEQNYRSTKNVIAWANSVIKNNHTWMKKELWTDNTEWEKITMIETPDDRLEAKAIVNIIKQKSSPQPSPEGEGAYSDNLILYRINSQSRQLEEALMIANIPYRVIWGLKFYDRKEIKDLLAYLRVIFNSDDVVSMKRIINTPTRKIGAKSIETMDIYMYNFWIWFLDLFENIDEVEELKPAAKKSILNFSEIINILIKKSENIEVAELIKEIIHLTKYVDYITDWLPEEEKQAKKDNIDELINLATEYNWMWNRESLSQFLEEVALLTDLDKEDKEKQDYVTLMTIHTSKWLEQKRVFVCWLEDWIFPSFRSVNDTNALEEERRLMYVAMTRAKDELYLSRANERFHFWDYVRNPESRFLKEIDESLLQDYDLSDLFPKKDNFFWSNSLKFHTTELNKDTKIVRKVADNDISQFARWDRVSHPKFGTWIITVLNWETADIAFSGVWVKKMNIRIAPVRKM